AHSREERSAVPLVAARTCARRGLEDGKLTEEDERFALRATREIVEELAALERRNGETRASGLAEDETPRQAVSVLCCPARDETDEIALYMLKESLDPQPFEVSLASPALLASEVVRLADE